MKKYKDKNHLMCYPVVSEKSTFFVYQGFQRDRKISLKPEQESDRRKVGKI